LNYAECSLNHTKCSLNHAKCSLNHAIGGGLPAGASAETSFSSSRPAVIHLKITPTPSPPRRNPSTFSNTPTDPASISRA
jgi:hypothetical protein